VLHRVQTRIIVSKYTKQFRQDTLTNTVLTLPAIHQDPLSIRAKALLFYDPVSLHLLRQIERIAPTDACVLIAGETGTGKELIARHLHLLSGRKGPFVAVNCGAFSESLIDAELFGHEAGAYTGALQSRAGWFETADQGTLFLDEIGDLPLHLQVKLLRVLQEQQVVRIGARKPVALNVRLIAATNVPLERAVQAGKFRADLFYRLRVAFIQAAPLRERQGDILPMANHFIQLYQRRLGVGTIELSADARQALHDYAWPGNIRELENVIHYALIVAQGGIIDVSDLSFTDASGIADKPLLAHIPHASDNSQASPQAIVEQIRAPQSAHSTNSPLSPTPDTSNAGTPMQNIEAFCTELVASASSNLYHTLEQTVIKVAYIHCKGNQVQTAKTLGISRNTLRTLLRRYDFLVD